MDQRFYESSGENPNPIFRMGDGSVVNTSFLKASSRRFPSRSRMVLGHVRRSLEVVTKSNSDLVLLGSSFIIKNKAAARRCNLLLVL